MEALFSVKNLSVAFQEEKGLHTVVNDISFEMEEGQILITPKTLNLISSVDN